MIKTKQELLNHFSDINDMYNNSFMYQTLSNMIDELLEQQNCEDAISREEVRRLLANQRDELIKLHTVNPKDNPKADAMAYGVNWSLNTLMQLPSVTPRMNLAETSQDCISREAVLEHICESKECYKEECKGRTLKRCPDLQWVFDLPSVKPKYTDEEIDKAQAVEQAYVDKMVELAVEESRREWLNSFDTNSATKCFEAVNILKERLEKNA